MHAYIVQFSVDLNKELNYLKIIIVTNNTIHVQQFYNIKVIINFGKKN